MHGADLICKKSRNQTNDGQIKTVLMEGAKIFSPLLVLHADLKRFMT